MWNFLSNSREEYKAFTLFPKLNQKKIYFDLLVFIPFRLD